HEACLLPIEDYPLYKRRMLELRDRHWWGRERPAELPSVEREVLARLEAEGPLPARAYEGRSEPMWGWKPAKRALEHLLAAGEVAIAGRQGFQRLYALPERVIPKQCLESPTPSSDEFHRGLALRAVRARGALTEAGIAEHCRFRGGARAVRPHVDELDRAPTAAVLLSPFDNLLWDRAFVRRLFGFEHVIEVYKRERERVYGYYVLPLLVADRLVGRADVKADRAQGVLQVKRFTAEPGVRRRLDVPLERAAVRLARSIGLASVER